MYEYCVIFYILRMHLLAYITSFRHSIFMGKLIFFVIKTQDILYEIRN